MNWRIGSCAALALIVWLAGPTGTARSAEDYLVRAFAQPSGTIRDAQQVQLVIRVEGTGSAEVAPPRLNGLVNFDVLAAPSQSRSSIWTNGRQSTTVQFVYVLLPRGPGAAEIPALSIEVDGQTYRTAGIHFDVQAGSTGPPPRAPANPPSAPAGQADSANVFLRAELGSREAWVGQAIPLTVLLYNATQISAPNWVKIPGLASFWVEDIEVQPEAEARPETVDGRRYTVYPMMRKVLVPQTPGEIEIEPFALQLEVRGRSRGGDPFGLFFGRTEQVVRKTEALKLRVRALPEDGKPAEFGGAVGKYTLTAALDRNQATVNDALSLSATVEGDGFLRSVEAPRLDVPPDLKVFDPKVTSTSRSVQGRLVSRKTWEWVLVPLSPGEMKLKSVRFAYFDTSAGRYVELHRDLPALVVQKGAAGSAEPGARAGDIQVQRRDLAFIKPLDRPLIRGAVRVHERAGYRTLAFLPLAWVPLVVAAGRWRAKLQGNQGLVRSRRARSRARRRLKSAERRLDSLDSAKFHEEVAVALVEYVADRFDRPAAGLTYELVDDLLASRNVDPDLRRRFRACLEACDFARFVPASAESSRKTEIMGQATRLMDELERAC